MRPITLVRILAGLALWAAAMPAAGQLAVRVAVIDSDRIVSESQQGQAIMSELKQLEEQKTAEGRVLEQEVQELQERIRAGEMSLAADKLAELKSQLEVKVRDLRRFGEDAQRELQEVGQRRLAAVEQEILKVIEAYGKESSYTLIFNKFRSGLVYADDAVDVTDEIIRRFDARAAGRAPWGGPSPSSRRRWTAAFGVTRVESCPPSERSAKPVRTISPSSPRRDIGRRRSLRGPAPSWWATARSSISSTT